MDRKLLTIIGILIACYIIPMFSPRLKSFMIMFLMYWGMAQAWDIFSGYTGYISIGHVVFLGLGVYTTVFLIPHLPLVLVLFISGLVAAIFSTLIGFLSLRIRAAYFVILTFGISETVKVIIQYYLSFSASTILIIETLNENLLLILILGIVAVIVLSAYTIKEKTIIRLALLSIQQDEEGAEAMGLDTSKTKITCLAVSAFFVGLLGSTVSNYWGAISTQAAFNPLTSFKVLIMASFGGRTKLLGPFIGTFLLLVVSEILSPFPTLYYLILGIVLAFLIKISPEGIVPYAERIFKRI